MYCIKNLHLPHANMVAKKLTHIQLQKNCAASIKVLYKLTWPSIICWVTNQTVSQNEDSAYFNNFCLYSKMRFLFLKLSKYVHFDHVCQKHIFLAIFSYFKDSNQKTKHQTPCTSCLKKYKENVEVLPYTSPNKVIN